MKQACCTEDSDMEKTRVLIKSLFRSNKRYTVFVNPFLQLQSLHNPSNFKSFLLLLGIVALHVDLIHSPEAWFFI